YPDSILGSNKFEVYDDVKTSDNLTYQQTAFYIFAIESKWRVQSID
ncbi:19805_t:CDS:1, partial [Funneliformis geosporum]